MSYLVGRAKGIIQKKKLVIISKPNVISEQKAVGFTELTSVLTASKSSHRKQAVSQNGLKIFVKLFRILMIQSIFLLDKKSDSTEYFTARSQVLDLHSKIEE